MRNVPRGEAPIGQEARKKKNQLTEKRKPQPSTYLLMQQEPMTAKALVAIIASASVPSSLVSCSKLQHRQHD